MVTYGLINSVCEVEIVGPSLQEANCKAIDQDHQKQQRPTKGQQRMGNGTHHQTKLSENLEDSDDTHDPYHTEHADDAYE
mmetsp:Transcript_12194/g.22852  ORF Transcript_12194/g.22852 Transcript_12194/m.22852 type:complete len:80 (+) Transcript_12194:772-1011(+)